MGETGGESLGERLGESHWVRDDDGGDGDGDDDDDDDDDDGDDKKIGGGVRRVRAQNQFCALFL